MLPRFQHRLHLVAQHHVGVADDASAKPLVAVATTGACRGDAVDEFDFASGLHCRGRVGPVHRTGLDVDGCDHIVTAVQIDQLLIGEITAPLVIPEMVVCIDDGQIGLDRWLVRPGKPSLE